MSERAAKKDKHKRMLKPNVVSNSGETSSPADDGSAGIDQSLLEKRLEGLRDTQESVQGLSLWCQAHKRHSSAIIETWLKILRKSPVEKRLTLFYLSNDVVQHARRKNDLTVVNQWAFAVQKATPLVRIPSSVSTAIARIFRIWEERNVYSKDTIADLLALLNNVPAKERGGEKKKPETYTASEEKVAAFQPSSLISKIKLAFRLKSHLGVTFRAKPFVHMDMETLKASIKDRSHGMEVIQEIGQLVEQLKASEVKLQSEVEERRKIVENAEIAIVFYENVRGEAKIVNSAYKNFTQRVLATKEKVEEKIKAFDEMEKDVSPVPSPPPEAPSPPLDEDDFGVPPADSHKPSIIPTENIRNDIMDALRTSMPISTSTTISNNHNVSQSTSSSVSSSMAQYDQGGMSSGSSLASTMQQQFQNSWSNATGNFVAANNFAAMIQQMLPGANNFLQMQQQQQQQQQQTYQSNNSYGTSGSSQGYDSYQPQSQQPPPLPGVDLSSIPLPPSGPGGDIPLPPPPIPQDYQYDLGNHHSNALDTSNNNMSSFHQDPSLLSHSSSYSDYMESPHNSYTPTSTTPNHNNSTNRYHPYGNNGGNNEDRNRRLSESSSIKSVEHQSPWNNSGGSDWNNGTASTKQGGGELSNVMSFDPMEMFQNALSGNKRVPGDIPTPSPGIVGGTGANQSIISNRSMSTDSSSPSVSSNQNFGLGPNPFYGGGGGGPGMYEGFDETDAGLNGDATSSDYVEPYTPRKPEMVNLGFPSSRGGRGFNNSGTPRSLFHNDGDGPRGGGYRGGGRGGQRGFGGGFRGRGPPRRGRGVRGGRDFIL